MSNLNAYPAPQTPLSGTEAIVAAQTQSGVAKTVTITLAQVATFINGGSIPWIVAGGTADAITATYAPPLTSLADGQLCWFRAAYANATTTPTFSPSGLTAHPITERGGNAIHVGDISGANAEIILRYDLANTRWELLNPDYLAALAAPSGSSLVRFLQSGANTVATDLQTLGREWVSVFDFMTAAQIADVIANTAAVDVTTALQNALNDGRAVYAPAGTYSYTSLYFDSCPMFVGAGQNKTILKPTAVAGNKITFGLNGVCQWGYYGHFSVAGNATTLIGIQLGASGTPSYYCANATFDKVRVTGFTAVNATGIELVCVQDVVFRSPVIKNNYRNVHRPDYSGAQGWCTTIEFSGRDGMVELATGDASVMLEGIVSPLILDGVTMRGNANSAIVTTAPINTFQRNWIQLRRVFFESNNQSGTSPTAELSFVGNATAHQGVHVTMEDCELHTQANSYTQLNMDHSVVSISRTDGLNLSKLIDTVNCQTDLLNNNMFWDTGSDYETLSGTAFLGVVRLIDRNGLSGGYWFQRGRWKFLDGVVGTQTNDSAVAGRIGEYIEADTNGTPVNSTGTTQWFDVASIALTKGDWDLSVMVLAQAAGATMTGGTGVAVSSTPGNSAAGLVLGNDMIGIGMPTATNNETGNIKKRVSIAATQTWYAKCNLVFSAGTPRAFAIIQARRIR